MLYINLRRYCSASAKSATVCASFKKRCQAHGVEPVTLAVDRTCEQYETLNREQTAVERISSQTYALSSECPICGHIRHESLPKNIVSLEVIVGLKLN